MTGLRRDRNRLGPGLGPGRRLASGVGLGFGDLVLCAGSVAASALPERIAAAAEAGFDAISLFPHDYERARSGGLSDAALRALLRDAGLAVAEIDPLLAWLPDGAGDAGISAEGRRFLAAGEDDCYAIADALGARSINAVLADPGARPLDAVADAFAALCERAAGHELLVTLEFLPWTPIRDAATAAQVVRRAGPNGGVMLDTWHHVRSGAPLASIPAARVLGVQLADAPAAAEADPIDETLHRRLVPGAGDADLPALLAHLARGDSPAPIGVEVFSDALAARPVREVARELARAARGALAAAGCGAA